jgi:hypothetical protein
MNRYTCPTPTPEGCPHGDSCPGMNYDENDPLQNRSITPYRGLSLPPIATESVDAKVYPYEGQTGHYHTDSRGILHRCYHHCRHRPWLWLPIVFVSQMFLFPLEHQVAEWLWSQPGLEVIADYMGWFEEPH